jgi:hypothetical protein
MAKFFKTRIVGGAKVQAGLLNLIPGARDRLREVIQAKAEEIANRARSNLSGGVLNKRSGYLFRSMKSKIIETDTKLIGQAFNNAPHAHLWEQGWGGKVIDVKAHIRRVKNSGLSKAKFRKIRRNKIERPSNGIAEVKAHDRKVPRQQKSFLKVALDEIRNSVYNSIRAAMFGIDKTL